jgi:hypothetical protein
MIENLPILRQTAVEEALFLRSLFQMIVKDPFHTVDSREEKLRVSAIASKYIPKALDYNSPVIDRAIASPFSSYKF